MTHTAELVERHTLTITMPTLGGNERVAVALARQQALAWAQAMGLEVEIGTYTGPRGVGVAFDVHVGHGTIAADQSEPGTLDAWKWSARWEWWRRVFNRADGRQGRRLTVREDGLASVTRLSRHIPTDAELHQPIAGVTLGDPYREPGEPMIQRGGIRFPEPTVPVVADDAAIEALGPDQ